MTNSFGEKDRKASLAQLRTAVNYPFLRDSATSRMMRRKGEGQIERDRKGGLDEKKWTKGLEHGPAKRNK